MTWTIGTSGWQYRDWRKRFYPESLPTRSWLEHYSERFRTVEVNNTFYRLPERDVFTRWAETVPDDFVFAIKMSRYLSHIKRMNDPNEPIERFLDRSAGLGHKRGPVLLQLPPTLALDLERLDGVLAAWPRGRHAPRLAIEFRHESWYLDKVRRRLEDHGVALCLTDRLGEALQPRWETADWTFIRFHEGQRRWSYDDATLSRWVARTLAGWGPKADVFVYFNNDPRAMAIRDACRFAAIAIASGVVPARVPGLDLAPRHDRHRGATGSPAASRRGRSKVRVGSA